jgi:VanZ family protein
LVSTASTATHISQETVSNTWQVVWWIFVKGYHVLEYTVLTLLLIAAFPVLRRYPLGAAGIAIAYACTDEFHQTFVPHRGGHVSDVIIDSLGVVIALVVHFLVQRRKLAKANA